MPTQSYTITCTKKQEIAPQIFELAFTKPSGFDFKPGQFVLFDVPDVQDHTDIQPRAYSIASTPFEKELLFVIRMKDGGGRMTAWIDEVLEVGTEMTIKGPFGLFTLRDTSKRHVFIATGTGIAPFRAHVHWLLGHEHMQRRIHLIFGVRKKEDLFWQKEFDALEAAHPNFRFHTALSRESDKHGHQGRVQTIIPGIIEDFSDAHIMICGNPAMVNDIKKHCLEDWGVPKEDVHWESYI